MYAVSDAFFKKRKLEMFWSNVKRVRFIRMEKHLHDAPRKNALR
jgi:hypothetical protein